MAQGGGNERQTLGKFVRNKSGYGTTVTTAKKQSQHRSSKYIKHVLQKDDNLMGLALKYQVTVEVIKRENKLWNNDMLFLREFVLIPLTPDNEHLADDDFVISITERDCAGSGLSNGSQEKDGGPEESTEKMEGREQEAITQQSVSSKKENPLDFFSKYDSDLAKLKSDVAKMEKNAEIARPQSHVPGRTMNYLLGTPDDYEVVLESETEC